MIHGAPFLYTFIPPPAASETLYLKLKEFLSAYRSYARVVHSRFAPESESSG
jgi:hypothetical protein